MRLRFAHQRISATSAAPAVVGIVLASLVLGACVGPARTDDTYRGKASATVERVRSSVEVAIVVARGVERHGLPAAYVSVLVGDADGDASGAEATFASIQPPSRRADAIRRPTLDRLADATDLLAEARVLSRRGDDRALAAMVPDLERTVGDLDALLDVLEAA